LYEANVNYTEFKPVTATVGYFHPFVSLEDATFPGDLLFLERPSIISIERSVAAGIQRASLGAKASTEDYFASVYLTGPVFGAQKDTLLNGEQLGFIGRLAARPYHDEYWNLHVGFSGQTVFHPNVNASGTPGVSRTTLTLGDFSELHIDFNELVGHGTVVRKGRQCLRRRARGQLAQLPDAGRVLPNRRNPIEIAECARTQARL
jgi:phosphate-selective porin OprO/OprP